MIVPVLLASPDGGKYNTDDGNVLGSMFGQIAKKKSRDALRIHCLIISTTYEPSTKDESVAIKTINAIFIMTLTD